MEIILNKYFFALLYFIYIITKVFITKYCYFLMIVSFAVSMDHPVFICSLLCNHGCASNPHLHYVLAIVKVITVKL